MDDGGKDVYVYRVYKGTDAIRMELFYNSSTLAINDSFVENGIMYYYSVSAVNPVGEGRRSLIMSATPAGLPGKVEVLNISSSYDMVTLSWNAPSNDGGSAITSFRLYKGDSPSVLSFSSEVPSGSRNPIIVDSGVTNGETYYYAVSAVNVVGEGPLSEPISATPGGPPTIPTNTAMTVKDDRFVITWDVPDSDGGFLITGYNVYRSESGGAWVFVTTVTDKVYEDTNLTVGKAYAYRVSAVNARGEGEFALFPEETFEDTGGASEVTDLNMLWMIIAIIAILVAVIVVAVLKTRGKGEGERKGEGKVTGKGKEPEKADKADEEEDKEQEKDE